MSLNLSSRPSISMIGYVVDSQTYQISHVRQIASAFISTLKMRHQVVFIYELNMCDLAT